MSFSFTGTGVAIVTPFNNDFSIDYDSFEKVINHTIDGKVEYIVVLGTTGESVTLNKKEKQELVQFCIKKVNGRVPIVIGIGGNNTHEVVADIKQQNFDGIAGLLSASPYYNKPSQEGIYRHFKAVAEASPVPVILYNVPGRTGSNMAASTTLRLANDFKNITAIKEASGNLTQITQIIKDKPQHFEVLSGDDALSFSMLSLGAKGVISVIANSHPFEFSELVRLCIEGEIIKARQLQFKLFALMEALFTEGSPGGIKSALKSLGLCKDVVRLPLTNISEKHDGVITGILKNLE